MRIEIQSSRKTSDSKIRNHENDPPYPFSAMSVLTVPVPVGCSTEPSPHRHITPHRATCDPAGGYGRVSGITISTRVRRVGTRSRRNSASASSIYTSSASTTGGEWWLHGASNSDGGGLSGAGGSHSHRDRGGLAGAACTCVLAWSPRSWTGSWLLCLVRTCQVYRGLICKGASNCRGAFINHVGWF